MIDKIKFKKIIDSFDDINVNDKKIGVLTEKEIHKVLKNYYSKSIEHQEVQLFKMYADIFDGEQIIEIQTKQFNKMNSKLKVFLEHYPTTIVYPLIIKKTIILYDADEKLLRQRKSPIKRHEFEIFKELYRIKPYLVNRKLKLKILTLETVEYRRLLKVIKWRKKFAKLNEYPIDLFDEVTIEYPGYYLNIIDFNEAFTSTDLANKYQIPNKLATVMLNVLNDIKIVKRIGKIKNSYLYEKNEEFR